jgi:uncharacterized cupin superfamily protein
VRKVNVNAIAEVRKGKEGRIGFSKAVSEALGRKPESTDFMERHPFDVEVLRVPPRSFPYRYHSHSASWEFYHVLSGTCMMRDREGVTKMSAGDACIFKPGEAHQIRNDGDDELVLLVVADNPIGESFHYPDDEMWVVNSPEQRYVALHPERERR